jgi:hypothetical protein
MSRLQSLIVLCVILAAPIAIAAARNEELPEEVAPFAKPPSEEQCCAAIRTRLTRKGLDYANYVGAQALAYKISKIPIPNFATKIAGPGRGEASAKDIKMVDYAQPAFWYKLVQPREFQWGTKGGSLRLRGKWAARYKFGISLKGKGTFDVQINDIRFTLGANFSQLEGRPYLTTSQCHAKVGDLNVRMKGGIIGFIVDRFSGKVEQQVRTVLNAKLCALARQWIDVKANARLATLPTVRVVGAGFEMNNSLLHDPQVFHDYIQAGLKGETSFIGTSHIPFNPPPMYTTNDTSRMLYMWGSDFVVNSMLSSAFRKNLLMHAITPKNTPEFAPHLRTTCPASDTCIGMAFITLQEKFPNRTCEFYLTAMEMPTVRINKARAVLKAEALGQMWVELENKTAQHLANFWIDFKGTLNLFILDNRLTGVLRIVKLSVNVTESKIGRFTEAEMDLFMLFVEPFLEGFINTKLKPGLPIPRIKDVTFVEPRIVFRDRAIEIQTDVQYMHFQMPLAAVPAKQKK